MIMDYNSTRPHLILAEYGRNIQNMVNHIMTLPSKEERNRYAQAVIDLMGHLNPHLRDVTDFKHKLWDHLFIISDFKLDVDSPYPIPSRETLIAKPQRIPYPSDRIRYKHYGKTVELMIAKAKTIEDPERRQALISSIANFMKMAYVTWNKDSVSDETIIHDFRELSGHQLEIDSNTNLSKVEVRPVKQPQRNFRDKSRNQQNNRKRNPNNPKRNY